MPASFMSNSFESFEEAAAWARKQFEGVEDCNPIPCSVTGTHMQVCGKTTGEWVSANGFEIIHRDGELVFAA